MKIILIIAIAFSLSFTTAFAHETIYHSPEQTHTKIPNYCVLKSTDSRIDEDQKDWMIKITHHTVEEWDSKLQETFNYSYKWQLMSTTISDTNQESNFKCDWIISFHYRPHSSEHGIILSNTDMTNQKIIIRFSEINEQKIHDVLLHEIGHSLGLGHFIAEDYQTISKQKTFESAPSIMIANIHNHPGSVYISQFDIHKLKSIHGTEGILVENEKGKENIQSELDSMEVLESLSVSPEKIIVKKYSSNTTNLATIYGKLREESVLSGVPFHIITTNPDSSTSISQIQPTSAGKFQIPLVFDQDFKKGEYSIELMYLERIISHHSVKYWVDDEFSVEPIQTIIETKEIPSWIKKNAKWWSDELVDDNAFVSMIQHLIKEGILNIPADSQNISYASNEIPHWLRSNAGWWADGVIDDTSFIYGIEYMIKQGIIKIN